MSKSFLDEGGLEYLITKIKAMLNGKAPASHVTNLNNPHEVTKDQVGLGNVDNTSDADKPVSTAQASAIAEAKNELTAQMSDISCIRSARFTVGSSANGWTAKDCDYLCDGTSDDNEINNAIKALPATGGEIVLLAGTYTIASAIKINKANVILRGNGSSVKLVRAFGGSSVNAAAVFITGTNCVVRDIAIDGVKDTYTTKSLALGIKSTGENNTIENCYIYNHAGDAIYIMANHNIVAGNIANSNYNGINIEGNHNIIRGNIITDSAEDGLCLTNAGYNSITGNVFRTSADNNIYFDDSSYNIVTGNNCAVLDDDEVSPTIAIFLSSGEGNIVFDNILGTGRLVAWGTNNNTGTTVPDSRTVNGMALSSDITLSASNVGAAPVIGSGMLLTYTNRTLQETDAGKFLLVSAEATITIPADILPLNTEIEVFRNTSGAVTIAAADGVSFAIPGNSTLVTDSQTISDQYSSIVLKQFDANVWSIQGAI